MPQAARGAAAGGAAAAGAGGSCQAQRLRAGRGLFPGRRLGARRLLPSCPPPGLRLGSTNWDRTSQIGNIYLPHKTSSHDAASVRACCALSFGSLAYTLMFCGEISRTVHELLCMLCPPVRRPGAHSAAVAPELWARCFAAEASGGCEPHKLLCMLWPPVWRRSGDSALAVAWRY